jgi:pimeloyl-ACP methyl ester carboxylesterase
MGANCVASTSIGCLFCCKGCSAEKIRNDFTFVPPQKSYRVEDDEKDNSKGKMVYEMEELPRSGIYRDAAAASEVRWVTTRKGSRIPVVWLHRQRPSAIQRESGRGSLEQEPIVLLHCHGNATDIGMMMGPYYELVKVLADLSLEVVGVEYSGYGAASGKPSAGNTYADLEAAYELVVSLGTPPNRIVAYGQSVGSGPVACLASKHQLGGIILHSPLLSGIKVVDPQPDHCCRPSCVWHCFDFFPNDRRVKALTCPVFIMHGQRDDIIPFYHGYRLHKACAKGGPSWWPPYFPQRAGHNDIMETDMRMYFKEVGNFLLHLSRLTSESSSGGPTAMGPTSGAAPEAPAGAGGALETPHQEDMASQPPPAVPLEAAGSGAGASASASTSEKEEEEAEEEAQPPPCSLDDFISAVPEPRCGPTDGRYEQMRRGNVLVTAGQGGAPGEAASAPGAEGAGGADDAWGASSHSL